MVAELVREAALAGARDELPHSIAVVVDEMIPREGRSDMLAVHATVFVERSSQKGIVIGHRGERLKAVGTAARRQIEALLGTKVYLDLHVTVAKDWQRDPRQLRKLGFCPAKNRTVAPKCGIGTAKNRVMAPKCGPRAAARWWRPGPRRPCRRADPTRSARPSGRCCPGPRRAS